MDLYEMLVRENALTEHIVLDISDIIDDIRPRQNPLLTMTMKASREKGQEFTSYWMEEGSIPTEVKYTGADEASAAATGVFADYKRLRKNDVLRRRESPFEYVVVTATPSSSTVALSRDWASYTGGSGLLKNGEVLDISGSLHEDSVADVTPRMTKPVLKYNFQQKGIDWVKIDKDYQEVKHRGGSIIERRINSAMNHHLMKLEKRMVLGVRASATWPSSTYTARTAGGLTYFLNTNQWAVGGLTNFTPVTFGSWVERVASRDPEQSQLTYYCSRTARRIISRWQMGKLAVEPAQSKRYGVTVEAFDAGAGVVVNLVTIPWFTGELSGYGFLVDVNRVDWKDLWKTKIEMNVGAKQEEYDLHKIKTTATILVHNQETMGWHYGAI